MPTAILAKAKVFTDSVAEKQFLTFSAMERTFAVPADCVKEIVEIEGLARIPMLSPFLLGLIGTGASALPIIDFLERFGCAPVGTKESTRAIVVEAEGIRLGLAAEHVDEATKTLWQQQLDAPAFGCGLRGDFIDSIYDGVAGKVIALNIWQVAHVYVSGFQCIWTSDASGITAQRVLH